MVTQKHTPFENILKRYTITGDSIQEIIEYIIPRIRHQSQDFYTREIELDLKAKKESMVDSHAGQGIFYILILENDIQL